MNNHKLNKIKTNNHPSPNQELYHPIFQVGKPWPSGLERRLKKYGWFSSGLNKLVFIPLLSLHFLQGRRYKALSQPSTSELNHHSLQGRRSRPLGQALPTLNRRWYSYSQATAFTIIEVVLVLAIAGLIFLMVFIALPALQRNQRDTQRKQDIDRAISALTSYQSNNRGRLPADWNADLANVYLRSPDPFVDPSGLYYSFVYGAVGTLPSDTTVTYPSEAVLRAIYVYLRAECAGNGNTTAVAGSTRIAFSIVLEGGGVYCVNN